MEFGEPLVERAVCEVRYLPTLIYHEKRIELCQELRDRKPEFLHWKLSTPLIQLQDESDEINAKKTLTVASARSSLVFRNPGIYDNFIALSEFAMRTIVETLQVNTLTRMGIRIFYFAEVNEGFDQLKDAILMKLLNRQTPQIFGASIDDLAYTVEFKKDRYNFNVRIGALSEEEIKGKLYKGTRYYPPKKELKPSLLVDVDFYRSDCPSSQVRAILNDSKTKTSHIVNSLLSALKE